MTLILPIPFIITLILINKAPMSPVKNHFLGSTQISKASGLDEK